MLSNKNKRVSTTLNYTEHFLNLVFTVTVCISIFALTSIVDISKGIMSSITGLNICANITRIKQYKSIIKKKEKKHDEMALLEKANLGRIKGSIYRSLTYSFIGRAYFLLIDVLREYDGMKEKISKL